MRYWLTLVQVPESDQLVDIARFAEQVGFHGISVADHLVMPTQIESRYPYTEEGEIFWPLDAPWPDPWVTLGAMASVTQELGLATNIYLAALRDPFTAAKAAATAAVLSANRIVCGVSAGWIAEEYALAGIDFASRGRRLDEQIEVMRKLWTGREIEHHGEFFDIEHAILCPGPSEPIPIWVGGASPPALRRAARHDGWFGIPSTVEQMQPYLQTLRREREAAGLSWEDFEVSISLAEPQTPENTAELEAMGVGSLCVIAPWVPSPWGSTSWFDEKADPGKLDSKQFAMERFAEAVVHKFG
ncbi:MAG: TIGR03619 family F420-dependent LLM class oxidoreductase [Deltaproteobacteria bacterium]|nr:TIGR03619 family F420-dependent LLM class oxidoreductase [Deltaproteobacteria bacterium]